MLKDKMGIPVITLITRPTSKNDDGLSNFVPHGTSTPAPNKLIDRDLGSHSEIISYISADEMKKRYFQK